LIDQLLDSLEVLFVELSADTSRIAATASGAEPPKNVVNRCRNAERLADSRERTGQ
jgi:hypothetical protein